MTEVNNFLIVTIRQGQPDTVLRTLCISVARVWRPAESTASIWVSAQKGCSFIQCLRVFCWYYILTVRYIRFIIYAMFCFVWAACAYQKIEQEKDSSLPWSSPRFTFKELLRWWDWGLPLSCFSFLRLPCSLFLWRPSLIWVRIMSSSAMITFCPSLTRIVLPLLPLACKSSVLLLFLSSSRLSSIEHMRL